MVLCCCWSRLHWMMQHSCRRELMPSTSKLKSLSKTFSVVLGRRSWLGSLENRSWKDYSCLQGHSPWLLDHWILLTVGQLMDKARPCLTSWDLKQVVPPVNSLSIYGRCHKKLYKIRGFTAWVMCSLSVASSRISTELSKGVHGIAKGYLRNCQRVSTDL